MRQPRCAKCGRQLKSLLSIARGMGPTCAGVTGRGQSMKLRTPRHSGSVYLLGLNSGHQQPTPIGDIRTELISKRHLIRRRREERLRLFEARQPLLSMTCAPLVYLPFPDDNEKEEHTGRTIPHERLQDY